MRILAFALLLALSSGAQASSTVQPSGGARTQAASPIGLWQNPKATLLVRTRNCGQALCGAIVWAGPAAIADARDAGVTSLVGTELLSGYRATGQGRWTGKVYVPDEGRRFYSTIQLEGADKLRISGCILGGLLCKHQEWTRR